MESSNDECVRPAGLGMGRVWLGIALCLALAGAACGAEPSQNTSFVTTSKKQLGALVADGKVRFRVFSERAQRIEVWIYAAPFGEPEIARHTLAPTSDANIWEVVVPLDSLDALPQGGDVYYGYRAWGPNWRHTAGWQPGSEAGFIEDVDAKGNRFNPNKLLIDPYAVEMSHDPVHADHVAAGIDARIYASGPDHRRTDSGLHAPKSIALEATPDLEGPRPEHRLRDDVIYEVHVRGLTMNDPKVPAELRGTYAGAALKAGYLRSLGVTAVELLPVQETQNDTNDLAASTDGDNYWGYATLAFFAPNRRYAFDRSPGGPTRELRDMVRAFHAEGIKVLVDVVFNHTGEGGIWDAGVGNVASLLSWRGMDNHSYYQDVHGNYDPTDPNVVVDHRNYWDNNGVAGNFRTAQPVVRDLVVDSLAYWHRILGVDGFRFDLASVLGNDCGHGCFEFNKMNPDNALNRAAVELPVRAENGGVGVELIAEPWAIGGGTYQLGNFPSGWAEWNGRYRDTMRKDQNQLGIEKVTPGALAAHVAGSSDLFGDDGRRPYHSVNFLVAHDGFTHNDLYACNGKNNDQPWPFGPSDGGEDNNHGWDHGGDRAAQRQASRTGMALLMLSAGVPMITGGDEMLRTQRCNNNAYNLDSSGNWIDWGKASDEAPFFRFTQKLIAFRRAHAALRPAFFFAGTDRDGNGLADVTWYRSDGGVAAGGYMESPDMHYLAWRLDADELGDSVSGDTTHAGAASIFVAYNGWSGSVGATLPPARPGKRWYRVSDTAAWMEAADNFRAPGQEDGLDGGAYDMQPRSLILLVER